MAFAEISLKVQPNAIETVSGRYVDVVNPDPTAIAVEDIIWSLCRQSRFAGHTLSPEIYTVGQHSYFVEWLLGYVLSEDCQPRLLESFYCYMVKVQNGTIDSIINKTGVLAQDSARVLMGALMHDATEAYLVDLPSPVKRHELLREPYKKLELGMQIAIDKALNLRPLTEFEEAAITWADLMALQIEAANLMPSRGRGWSGDLPAFDLSHVNLFVAPLPWHEVSRAFMDRYQELESALN